MKGQIRLEFIFGVVMFAVVVFWVVSQIDIVYAGVGSDSRNDMMRAKAYNLIAYLAEGSGDPGWESATEPKRIGLAYEGSPYNLSTSKIDKLNSTCSLLDNYDIRSYRVFVKDSSGTLLTCGSASISPITISIERSVFIEGNYGTITVEVW